MRATISLILSGILIFSLPQLQAQDRLAELIRQFEGEKFFFRQFELAKAIADANDVSVLPKLERWLTHEDRHARGNAAYIFARLGDPRGFNAIVAILRDRSEQREIHQISSVGQPWLQGQIANDRYYAAHLLGDLKDPRAIPILVPLLKDREVAYVAPWSLGQIGDRAAVPPLLATLSDPDPNMRVLAIYALADLKAREALPRLRELLSDEARSNFDKMDSVAGAARTAIVKQQGVTRD